MRKLLIGLLAFHSLSVFAAPNGDLKCNVDFYSNGKKTDSAKANELVEKLDEGTYQRRLSFTSDNGRFSFEVIAQVNLDVVKKKSITVWMRDNKLDLAHDTESIGNLTDERVESRFKQFDKNGGYNYGTDGYVGKCSLNFNL